MIKELRESLRLSINARSQYNSSQKSKFFSFFEPFFSESMHATTGVFEGYNKSPQMRYNGSITPLKDEKRMNSLLRERKSDAIKSKIYLRMLMKLSEKFGTNPAHAPVIKEVLNEYLLMRPNIDSEVS